MNPWDQRYDRPDYLFGEEPNAFLARQAELVKRHKQALAVADGEGRNGVWLAEQGLQVTSIDASAIALAKAERLAARKHVSVTAQRIDIADYDWPAERFDLVVAIFIQFAPPALRDEIFAGIIRALAPGGTLLLQGYRPEQLAYGTGGPQQVEQLYTEALLRDRFAELDIISLACHDSELQEGAGHGGMSALIDLVARKW
jgi:SAM-dependent methyltransferase